MKIIWLGNCFRELKNRQSKDELTFCDRYLSPSCGELSITLGVKKLFAYYYPNTKVVAFDRDVIFNRFGEIRKIVNRDDLIFIHGGEFGACRIIKGQNYEEFKKRDWRRKIMETFPNNKIVVLGCTIYYGDGKIYSEIIENDKKIFDRKNLVLMARDYVSYNELQKYFSGCKCRILLCPDPALFFNPLMSRQERGDGALLLLRKKHESRFNQTQKQYIKQLVETIIPDVHLEDINTTHTKRFRKCLREYHKYKIVITDRYHGMIFASLTHTPCVAIDDALPHKISGAQCFFSSSIQCIKEIEDIPNAINLALSKPFKAKDLTPYFDVFKEFHQENKFSDDLIEMIKNRRSIRKWISKPVEEGKIRKILEAGIWSPTAGNTQRVRFYVLKDKKLMEKIIKEGVVIPNNIPNKIILVLYDMKATLTATMKKNFHKRFIWQDTSAAMMNMILMAEALGLKTCWVSTTLEKNRNNCMRKALKINKRYVFCCMLFVGYSNQKVPITRIMFGKPLLRSKSELVLESVK